MSWFKSKESQSEAVGQPSKASTEKIVTPYQGSSLKGRRLSSTRLWRPRCLSSYVDGFDELVLVPTDDGEHIPGGLPLGSPGITLLAGSPGTGKSVFLYNLFANQLNHGVKAQFHTFEKPPEVVAYNIANIAFLENLENVKVTINEGKRAIEGLEIVDSFTKDHGKQTVPLSAKDIVDWHKETGGQLVAIDSVTDMTAWEGELRTAMRDFINRITEGLEGSEISIIATSQHRGARQDPGIAGGIAIAHRCNAVIQVDHCFVSVFDKGYYGVPRGVQVRRIWVEKTADFAHSSDEHFFTIDQNAICSVGKSIAKTITQCFQCGTMIDPSKEEFVRTKLGTWHRSCYDEQLSLQIATDGFGKEVNKALKAENGLDKGIVRGAVEQWVNNGKAKKS